jgi:hypothetical protein
MEIRFSKWEKSGLKRIYVNGLPVGGAAVWFEANSQGNLTEKTNGYKAYSRAQLGPAVNEAYEALEAIIGPIPFGGIEFNKVYETL